MKIAEFRALAKEELPEAPWISKLLDPLNRFLSSVRAALANGLTFADNFNAEIRTVELTTRAGPTGCAVLASRSATPHAFGSGAQEVAVFDTEALDTAGAYDPATGLFRAPSAGLYHVSAAVTLAGLTPGTGEMLVEIRTASGTPAARGTRHAIHSALQSETVSAVLALDADEWVGVFVYQSNGAARSTEPVARSSYLSVARMGGPDAIASLATPVRWKSKVRGKLTGISVLRCVEVVDRNEKPVLAALGVDWAQDGENTIISGVAGLTGGKTYRLTVVAFGG
jgi:hypothetical protein